MAAVLADPATRAQHVDAIAAFAADGEYDGIDIDYEQFAFADGRDTWADHPSELGGVHHRTRRPTARRRSDVERQHPARVRRRPDDRQWLLGLRLRSDRPARRHDPHHGLRLLRSRRRGRSRRSDGSNRHHRARSKRSGSPDKLVLGIPAYGRNWPTFVSGACPADAEGRTSPDDAHGRRSDRPSRSATPVYVEETGEWFFEYELEVTTASRRVPRLVKCTTSTATECGLEWISHASTS